MKSSIKTLVWVYLVLLFVEGALRKWVAPSLADPLLVARDPVLLVIYGIALLGGVFPLNRWIVIAGALALASALASLLAGQTNPLIIAYGIRINYLHLPLIWIMGALLDRRDIERMGVFFLMVAVPMTIVMILQFRSPMGAFINRGVGGDEMGQIFGADDRIRPPGLFAFITGPQLFYPLCAAFFLNELAGASKRLRWPLLVAAGIAIAVAVPVSISRYAMLATGIVVAAFLCSLPFTSRRLPGLVRPLLLLAVLAVALSQLNIFKEGRDVFMMRWETAAAHSNGTAWDTVVNRTVNGFTNPYYFMKLAPALGYGIGTGSNVGARLTTGHVGFLLAEEEWGKVLLELGPLLGSAFILFRIALTVSLGLLAWGALRRDKNALPTLIFAASAPTILQGQWGPPTVLGFAIVGAGLLLASLNPAPDEVKVEEPVEESRSRRIHAELPAPSPRRPPIVLRPATR